MNFYQHLRNVFPQAEADSLQSVLTQEPYHSLRLNPQKITSDEFKEKFPTLTPHPFVSNGFYFQKDSFPFGKHPYHQAGLYYIQEPSAMMVGELLCVEPHDKIIDLCAAPGGKSTHVASLLEEDGFLISNDVSYSRAQDLSENIERFGLKNTIIVSEEVTTLAQRFSGFFDKVILDAPCSGEGMFRKSSAMSDDWSFEKVQRCSRIQHQLIHDAYRLLKKGGIMIYSTCTYATEENEEVIRDLLEHSNAKLIPLLEDPRLLRGNGMEEAIRLAPHRFPGEGHFIAKIQSGDDPIESSRPSTVKVPPIPARLLTIYRKFEEDCLRITLPTSRMVLQQNHLHLLPASAPSVNGLRIVRNGLHLGEFSNERFIPSHALSLAFRREDWKQVTNHASDSEFIRRYLAGESLPCDTQGYTLVCVDSYPLGLGKASQGILKNHYPKGLRIRI